LLAFQRDELVSGPLADSGVRDPDPGAVVFMQLDAPQRMSWVTIIGSMSAALSLTLGVVHLVVWLQDRKAWASLFFALTALAVAWFAAHEKHFVSKLTDADGEQMETQHWVDEAVDCDSVSTLDAGPSNHDLAEAGRMMNSMMGKADSFCCSPDSQFHDVATEYFTANPAAED
jgi:hypothetical protein